MPWLSNKLWIKSVLQQKSMIIDWLDTNDNSLTWHLEIEYVFDTEKNMISPAYRIRYKTVKQTKGDKSWQVDPDGGRSIPLALDNLIREKAKLDYDLNKER